MTDRESEVPLDLKQTLDDADTGTNITGALALFPPDDWPACPDCGAQLDPISIGVGAQGNLVGARMVCTDHEPAHKYVYEASTSEVYFDGNAEPVLFGALDGEYRTSG